MYKEQSINQPYPSSLSHTENLMAVAAKVGKAGHLGVRHKFVGES